MNDYEEIIPELHDALKLTRLKHDLKDFGDFQKYEPTTKTWQGIRFHHAPCDFDTLILSIADHQAASFTRHLEQELKICTKKESQEKHKSLPHHVHKLWNPPMVGTLKDHRLKKENEIIELLELLKQNPTFESFLSKYREKLSNLPEDMWIGVNVTSLLSHMVITGKLYRIFKNSKKYLFEEPKIAIWQDQKKVKELIAAKEGTWNLYIGLLELDFHQNPFRAKDLSIFDLRQETMNLIADRFRDHIMMRFDNRILLAYDDPQIIKEIVDIAKDFLVTEVSSMAIALERIRNLDPINPQGEENPKPIPRKTHYADLPLTIEPDLCEICQMAHATQSWKEALEEGRKEDLCPQCFQLRQRPSRLKQLAQWSETGDALVAWIQHSLHYGNLLRSLKNLYRQYVQVHFDFDVAKNHPNLTHVSLEEITQIKFSMIEEFSRDYRGFVEGFNHSLKQRFGEQNFESVNDWLTCVRLIDGKAVFAILEDYNHSLNNFFPALKDLPDGPFSFKAAICSSKFPFSQVWRQFNRAEREIEIAMMGHGLIATDHPHLDALLKASQGEYRKTVLHSLAEVAKISEALAQIKFNDQEDRQDHPTYQRMKSLVEPLGMDFSSILTLAQLLEV